MKFFRSYKTYTLSRGVTNHRPGLVSCLCIVSALVILGSGIWLQRHETEPAADAEISLARSTQAQAHVGSNSGAASSHTNSSHSTSGNHSQPARQASTFPLATIAALPIAGSDHPNITTTVFWVGEAADSDNGYISNSPSAWDEHWQSHYGGIDSPSPRSGYYPSGFTPKENPFYVALPYSDFTDSGNRKASANLCANNANPSLSHYSWCKNTWIAIKHGGKTVYAQWEDVGPFEEDDVAYVFGSASPKNTQGAKAGLDVSPAVRDYLGLQDVDNCSWSFVSASNVPPGPWSQIITTSKGDQN